MGYLVDRGESGGYLDREDKFSLNACASVTSRIHWEKACEPRVGPSSAPARPAVTLLRAAPTWVLLLAGLLLSFVGGGTVRAQITFDSSSISPGGNVTSDSWSHTVTSAGRLA